MQIHSVINQPNLISANYQDSITSLIGRFLDYLFLKTTKSASSNISTESGQLSKNVNLSSYLNYRVVHLTGKIDLYSSAEIRRIILLLLKQDRSLLIDFSNLSFIDCSVIAILVEALKISKSRGLCLSIIGAKASPLQLFKLTHLNSVFTLFNRFEDVKTW